ncbi:MAG: 2,3-bisphosphoglycerate-independent phosphoglycerate mutase [Candidatus Methanomethylicia archaeon]
MVENRIILIVADGMGDRLIPELNHKTPLEVANKPNIDSLARSGLTGIIDVIGVGIPPGSAPANLALLGYDPYNCYSGRGAFEALGIGLNLMHGDIAFRANFATVNDDFIVLDRRAGRYLSEGDILAEEINKIKIELAPDISIVFKRGVEHRGALILRGPNLSKDVSDTDPEKENLKVLESKPLSNDSAALRTAKILNEFTIKSYNVLSSHPANLARLKRGDKPANIILCRGAGTLPNIQPFNERYGLRGVCIAGVPLIKGVAKAVGLDVIEVEGATGGLNSDLMAKAEAAIKSAENYDFIFVHVKGTDTASHDGLLHEKIRMIESIDRMVGKIIDGLSRYDIYMAITADHCTPINVRDHIGDPVPVLVYGKDIVPDYVENYNERDCLKGGIGRIRGLDLMPLLLNYSLKAKKYGE